MSIETRTVILSWVILIQPGPDFALFVNELEPNKSL